MKHMLIAQSGGPSAAINATVAGVVERCMTSGQVGRIYGARNGIKGVIDGNYIDLTEELASPERLELLCHTPAAALGSCRLKLNNADEEQLGEDAVREIIVVFLDQEGETSGSKRAVKRSYAVIPNGEGDKVEAYTRAGDFKCRGPQVFGEVTSTDDWKTVTFTADT